MPGKWQTWSSSQGGLLVSKYSRYIRLFIKDVEIPCQHSTQCVTDTVADLVDNEYQVMHGGGLSPCRVSNNCMFDQRVRHRKLRLHIAENIKVKKLITVNRA